MDLLFSSVVSGISRGRSSGLVLYYLGGIPWICGLSIIFISISSKKTNNQPLVYIKYNVYNKYVTFLFLSFPFPFTTIFHIFIESGGNIPATSIFGGFQIFSPKTLNFVCFVIFHK